jgi:hypothetical protein
VLKSQQSRYTREHELCRGDFPNHVFITHVGTIVCKDCAFFDVAHARMPHVHNESDTLLNDYFEDSIVSTSGQGYRKPCEVSIRVGGNDRFCPYLIEAGTASDKIIALARVLPALARGSWDSPLFSANAALSILTPACAR